MKSFKLPGARRLKTGTSQIVSFEIPRIYEPAYRELVRRAPDPDRLDLVIAIPSKKRSTGRYSQSAHFNGHVQQIAQHTGNDFEDVKIYIKRQALKRGLRFKTKPNGDIVYSLIDLSPMPISETEMTTEECAMCIEECHALAADMGIALIEE